MNPFGNLDISASGIRANRQWMEVISSNIANSKTTRTPEGGPYRAKEATFASYLENAAEQPGGKQVAGVKLDSVVEDPTPFLSLYNPSHPDANEKGYVLLPNVDPMREMARMMIASRSYEANIAAFGSSRSMYQKALEIGK